MLPRNCSGHLYHVLQVSPESTTEEISRGYRALALRYHPDRTGGASTEAFQEIEEAHRILRDPAKRRLYHALGREQMKFIDDSVLVGSLGALAALRAALAVLWLLTCALLISFILIGVRLDARKDWSWALVTLPLWVLAPFVVGFAGLALLAAVRASVVVLAVVGLEAVVLVVCAVVSTLALSGGLSASSAFIPWTVWFALATVRGLYFLIPAVFAENRRKVGAAMRAAEGGPPGPDWQPRIAWSWKEYAVEAARELWRLLCGAAFIGLAFERAAQGPVDPRSPDPKRADGGEFLSFWVVFAPLIAHFGVLVLAQAVFACLCTPSIESDSLYEIDPTSSGERAADGRSAYAAQKPSCGMRLLYAVLAIAWPGSWLYMACMWAAKMEFEYNWRTSGNAFDPSFFVACMPLFVVMTFTSIVSFCSCCGLGLIASEPAEAEGEIPEQPPAAFAGGNEGGNAKTWEGKPSGLVQNYRSFDHRGDANQAALSFPSPNTQSKTAPTLNEID